MSAVISMDAEFHAALSDAKFDCFDYFDLQSLSPELKTNIALCMDEVVVTFLRSISYQHKPSVPDESLRHELREWSCHTIAESTTCCPKLIDRILNASAHIAETFYPSASHETKLQKAMSTEAAFPIDRDAIDKVDLPTFQFDMWQQRPPRSKWAAMFANVICIWSDHFDALDQRLWNLGAMGWANYIESSAMEQDFVRHPPTHLIRNMEGQSSIDCGL